MQTTQALDNALKEMTEAMKTARANGYKLAVLDSSPLAEDLYKRLGFTTVTSFPLFTSEPAYL